MRHEWAVIVSIEGGDIDVLCPTPELHALGALMPAARKTETGWRFPLTARAAISVAAVWRQRGLEGTREFLEYLREAVAARAESSIALATMSWPDIPITIEQPTGKWEHQRRAFWFAYPLEASMLGLTMGGGKTKLAIDLMQNWGSKNVLIISPLAACEDAWLPQLDKYVVGQCDVGLCYTGTQRQRCDQMVSVLSASHVMTDVHRIVLTNHDAFWRQPLRGLLLEQKWDLIIADESHREKAAGSKRSVCLSLLGRRAARRLCMTGTPLPHSPLDAYGQYRFLDPAVFGTNHARFAEQYAVYGGYMFRDVIGYKNLEDFGRKFYSIGIVVDDSTQGLPETVDITHSVTLEPATRKIYEDIDIKFIAECKKSRVAVANVGVRLLRLHQTASGIFAAKTGDERIGDEKIRAVRDILEDLGEKEPVVIFTRFDKDTQDLAESLGALQLSGSLNQLAEWKKGYRRILVAQIQAAKEGIDLTRAAVAVFYSTGISLGDYEQCRKRLHRPPQKRMVRFIHILAKGTRDVTTMRSLRERRDVVRDALKKPQLSESTTL